MAHSNTAAAAGCNVSCLNACGSGSILSCNVVCGMYCGTSDL